MATLSYFQRFQKPSSQQSPAYSQRNAPTSPISTQPVYQSGAKYPATQGIQAPGGYQPPPQPYYTPWQQTSGQPISPKLQQQIALQQSRMGNLSYMSPGDRLLQAKDLPWLQANLAQETALKSEQDRQQAYEELQRAWMGLGQSPESLAAKQAAMEAVQRGGPWNQQALDVQRGAIRNAGGVSLQSSQRRLAEELARRGMGGSSLMGMQQAQLGSQASFNIQQQLAELERNAIAQNEAARQAALAQLSDLSGAEQAQRLGLDQALADLYSSTQRETLDLSPLAEAIKKGKRVL